MPDAPLQSSTDEELSASSESRSRIIRAESPNGPSALHAQRAGCRNSLEFRPLSRATESAPSLAGSPAPSLVILNVDMIFKTIEQLTLKLNMLKEMEAAHRDLLKSFNGGQSGRIAIVEDARGESDTRTTHHHNTQGSFSSPLFARNLQPVSLTEDGHASISEVASTWMNFTVGLE